MKRGRYKTPVALKADFVSVSLLGDTCAVFNIGNRYRLVAYVLFRTKRVYIADRCKPAPEFMEPAGR